ECAFILPGGKKCRCMANRNHKFCRHHGAPFRHRTAPGDRPWSRLACWRDLVRSLPAYPKQEIPGQLLQVLYSLKEGHIADRTAGRILRTLLQRYGDLPLMPTPETGLVRRDAPPLPPKITIAGIPLPDLGDLDDEGIDRLVAQLTPKK
ncbi:MAG TPA: hypothetical protein VGS02_17140, partial [Acidobacteriaceae bacterium]|nr:hypothetical protein [Acidobacteriaceae bacterium]